MLWRTLSNANDAIAVMFDTLTAMAQMDPTAYETALKACASSKADDVRSYHLSNPSDIPVVLTLGWFASIAVGQVLGSLGGGLVHHRRPHHHALADSRSSIVLS